MDSQRDRMAVSLVVWVGSKRFRREAAVSWGRSAGLRMVCLVRSASWEWQAHWAGLEASKERKKGW